MNRIDSTSFFGSSITLDNRFQDLATFKRWFASRCRPDEFTVERVPLSSLDKWKMDRTRGAIVHESGKFFSIQGIGVSIDDDRRWDQPIINQPEIGVLGLLTRVFDGVRYFLVQAKMEPGNINTLQVSPTLQATRSNFSRVHRGKSPAYLDYFDGTRQVRILVDQLQTEQGARFMRKQNRNIIIEVSEDVPMLDDFCWLTLGELKRLLLEDNLINMDLRSVLSTIPLIEDNITDTLNPLDLLSMGQQLSGIGVEYIKSYLSNVSYCTTDDVLSWYNRQRVAHDLTVTDKPLWDLEGWQVNDDMIVPDDDRFFSVIGVKVQAGNREVNRWMQPLIADSHEGLLAFIVQEIDGILHFLVQAKIEPGNRDIVELSPTVSCSNHAHVAGLSERPPLFDEVFDPRNRVLLNVVQSEEGGRFYQLCNRNMIVRLPADRQIDPPEHMMWMSLRQIKEFMRYGLFNVEARSIISGISFID